MKKLSKKLKSNRGEIAVSEAAKFIFSVFCIVLGLAVLSVAYKAVKLELCNSVVVRHIEILGDSTTYQAEVAKMLENANLKNDDYTAKITATYISGTKHIQYANEFSSAITYNIHIRVGNEGSVFYIDIPIPLKSEISGRSEQYWK